MLIALTLPVIVLSVFLAFAGLVGVVLLGIKNSQAAFSLSAVWTMHVALLGYMFIQNEFGAYSLIALAVLDGTMIHLVRTAETELLN